MSSLYIVPCTQYFCDEASTIEKIKQIGMNASSFAVVGDAQSTNDTGQIVRHDYLFSEVIQDLNDVRKYVEDGKIRLIENSKEIPHYNQSSKFVPGAILALEGAIPLAKNEDGTIITDLDEIVSRVDTLYNLGVRIITLMHFWSNELESVMTDANLTDGSLTRTGQAIVECMMEKKMIVDVAHAHKDTLEDITMLAIIHKVPIIDSHTGLIHGSTLGSRRRTIEEMEMIAQTGGVVCTWPSQACNKKNGECSRTTFIDWANEIKEIAGRIGITHVGLGTDGGGIGSLGKLIDGYESILDLPKLVKAMEDAGLKRSDIAAYMGRNIETVMKRCID